MPDPVLTDALMTEILDRIPSESLLKILKDEGMPSYPTVMRRLASDEDFAKRYRLAREYQAHHDADLVADIRQQMLDGKITADVGRAAIDACKWTAGRRLPKVYTERLALEHDVSDSLAERMKAARERGQKD